MSKEDRAKALTGGANWQGSRQRAQAETQEIPFKHKKCLYCAGGRTLEQVVLNNRGVSICRGVKNMAGHCLEQLL